MKKRMFVAMMMTVAISASAMTYGEARNEALFLSDKMAYELNLSEAQYERVYQINLDYLMRLNHQGDVAGPWLDRRNADLRMVLTARQFDRFMALTYFYRPVSWHAGTWRFHIYDRYVDRGRYYRPVPGRLALHDRRHHAPAPRMNRPAPQGHRHAHQHLR